MVELCNLYRWQTVCVCVKTCFVHFIIIISQVTHNTNSEYMKHYSRGLVKKVKIIHRLKWKNLSSWGIRSFNNCEMWQYKVEKKIQSNFVVSQILRQWKYPQKVAYLPTTLYTKNELNTLRIRYTITPPSVQNSTLPDVTINRQTDLAQLEDVTVHKSLVNPRG